MKIVFGALIFALLLDALDAFIPKVSAFQTLGNGQMTQARNRRQMLNTINFFGAPKVPKSQAKQALLDAIALLDRGRLATDDQKQKVAELFAQLEKVNTIKRPLASPLVNGRWTLVYTTSEQILAISKPKFLQSVGPIYQFIDVPSLSARNEEVLCPLPFLKIKQAVNALLTPKSDSEVGVKFTQFEIGPIKFSAPDWARGSLDVTYLDENLRLSRGDKGNIFVLVKEM